MSVNAILAISCFEDWFSVVGGKVVYWIAHP
jgi:hypothetical protein